MINQKSAGVVGSLQYNWHFAAINIIIIIIIIIIIGRMGPWQPSLLPAS